MKNGKIYKSILAFALIMAGGLALTSIPAQAHESRKTCYPRYHEVRVGNVTLLIEGGKTCVYDNRRSWRNRDNRRDWNEWRDYSKNDRYNRNNQSRHHHR